MDVRSLSGVPTISDFISSAGTPLVLNQLTGFLYTLDASDNIIIIGQVLGTSPNYTTWNATSGHVTMFGDARPWRDELGDALSLRSIGTRVTQNASESTVEFTSLAAAATDYLFLNVQLNHDKDLAASIYPHIHFFQESNAVPNFLLQYRWQVNGGSKVTSWTNLKCNTLAVAWGSGTRNNIAYSSPITVPAGTTLSDIVQFRICRDTANVSTLFAGADPYSGTVGITAFDVHFMINSFGSDTEYTK
jgi:hypothetical protein